MNPETGWARRYHWLSSLVKEFVCEPHAAIVCDARSETINMVAKESRAARDISSFLARSEPGSIIQEINRIKKLNLPRGHSLLLHDINPDNIRKVLLTTYERKPRDFEALLGINGVGPKTIRALALLSELIYNAEVSRRDPASYSFAHGGKDGYPYPVSRRVYDNSIEGHTRGEARFYREKIRIKKIAYLY